MAVLEATQATELIAELFSTLRTTAERARVQERVGDHYLNEIEALKAEVQYLKREVYAYEYALKKERFEVAKSECHRLSPAYALWVDCGYVTAGNRVYRKEIRN